MANTLVCQLVPQLIKLFSAIMPEEEEVGIGLKSCSVPWKGNETVPGNSGDSLKLKFLPEIKGRLRIMNRIIKTTIFGGAHSWIWFGRTDCAEETLMLDV